MATVILTTSSTSPWLVPGDFTVAGHKVILLGAGGNGGVGTTGTSGTSGGGGAGGACTQLTYSSGTITLNSTTIPFFVAASNAGTTVGTQWESSAQGSGAYYEALSGGAGAAAGTAGAAPGSTTT